MNKIILIGGAPGSGKTTLAKKVAEHFQIPWISTDQIREIVKASSSEEKYPQLFLNTKELSIDEAIPHIISQSEAIWDGIAALIKRRYPWDGFVIEGIAVLPSLITRDFKENTDITSIFLVQTDKKNIKQVIEERSKLPWIKTKTEEQKERQCNEIALFNDYLKNEVEKHQLSFIEVDNFDNSYQKVMGILNTRF